MAPLPPAAGGSGVKILLVVLGCLAVLGIAGIAGVYYVVHRVKQVVVEKAAENGVDLSSITSPVSHTDAPKPRPRRVCDYLSKEEVSQLISEPVERAEIQDAACMYYGPPGLTARLAQEQTSKAFQEVQKPNAHVSSTDFENLDQVVGSLTGQGVPAANRGEMPLLMLVVDPDGKAQMTAMTASQAIFGGIFKAAEAGSMSFGGMVPNLGDKAVRMPKLGLNVLQGNVFIRVIPGPMPDPDAKTIAVARAVLKRI